MNDAPLQLVLQQSNARRVSGEELETLGVKAASIWGDGQVQNLTEAVIEVVKHAQLSPEQVRRVVEFTNQKAYLCEFEKGGEHRVVHFEGGPADPADVLKDLNDGGGGTVFDRGNLDYDAPPSAHRKHSADSANEDHERALEEVFRTEPEKLAYAEPFKPLEDLYFRLQGASRNLESDLDKLEIDYIDASINMYDRVKEATKNGASLGDVVTAWSVTDPDDVQIKSAFQVITPRLRNDALFPSLDEIGVSLTKVGSDSSLVNRDHPLVTSFVEYCDVLSKLAGLREIKSEVDEGLAKTELLLKQALGGAAGKAWEALGRAGKTVGGQVGDVANWAVGADPKAVGDVAAKAVQYGGAGAGILGANAALQEVTDRPVFQAPIRAARSIVPGTQEYAMRRYRIASGGGAY